MEPSLQSLACQGFMTSPIVSASLWWPLTLRIDWDGLMRGGRTNGKKVCALFTCKFDLASSHLQHGGCTLRWELVHQWMGPGGSWPSDCYFSLPVIFWCVAFSCGVLHKGLSQLPYMVYPMTSNLTFTAWLDVQCSPMIDHNHVCYSGPVLCAVDMLVCSLVLTHEHVHCTFTCAYSLYFMWRHSEDMHWITPCRVHADNGTSHGVQNSSETLHQLHSETEGMYVVMATSCSSPLVAHV